MEPGPLTREIVPEPFHIHFDPWRNMVADDLQFGECTVLHERPEHLFAAHFGAFPWISRMEM